MPAPSSTAAPAPTGTLPTGRLVTTRLPRGRSGRIVVKDKYPAYIDWADLRADPGDAARQPRGVSSGTRRAALPRDGAALLQGIVWCGECGHKMVVQYRNGNRYVCNHSAAYPRRSRCASTCRPTRSTRAWWPPSSRRSRRPNWRPGSGPRRPGTRRTRRSTAPRRSRSSGCATRRAGRAPVQPGRSRQPPGRRRAGTPLGGGPARAAPGRGGAGTTPRGQQRPTPCADGGGARRLSARSPRGCPRSGSSPT